MNNKIFVLEPRSGLCNQLNCIAIGLILGSIYNRNIYFNGFQVDYSNEYILNDFVNVIDINHLNRLLNQHNINTKIIDKIDENIDSVKVLETDNKLINDIKNIFTFIKSYNNLDNDIINLKNPISTYIPEEMNNFYNFIKLNIKFNDKYINIANQIIEKYKLHNFCCIHLRMEDDAIKFTQKKLDKLDTNLVNDIYKQTYINEIEIISKLDVNIYICTSLGMSDNINNLFYKVIKKQYNLIDKYEFMKDIELYDSNFNHRELYGIIDYLIALKSTYFIGCDWSSFSIAIKNNHEYHKKDYNLLNIWESSSKY